MPKQEKSELEIIYNFLVKFDSKDLNKRLEKINKIFGSYSNYKSFGKVLNKETEALRRLQNAIEKQRSQRTIDKHFKQHQFAQLEKQATIERITNQVKKRDEAILLKEKKERIRIEKENERKRLRELREQEKAIREAERKEMKRIAEEKRAIREREARAQKRFNHQLGIGLGMLFTSMTIHQRISNILNSIQQSYLEITKGQTLYSNSVNRLRASFEFLKFSIMNALERTPAGVSLMNTLTKIVDKFAEFADAHPTLAFTFLFGGKVISAIADILQIVSTIFVLLASIALMKSQGGTIKTILSVFTSVSESASKLLGFIGKAIALGGLIINVVMLLKSLFSDDDGNNKLQKLISHLLGIGGWTAFLLGHPLIGVAVIGIKFAWDTWGEKIINLFTEGIEKAKENYEQFKKDLSSGRYEYHTVLGYVENQKWKEEQKKNAISEFRQLMTGGIPSFFSSKSQVDVGLSITPNTDETKRYLNNIITISENTKPLKVTIEPDINKENIETFQADFSNSFSDAMSQSLTKALRDAIIEIEGKTINLTANVIVNGLPSTMR